MAVCPYCQYETEPDLRYHERGDCGREVFNKILIAVPDDDLTQHWMRVAGAVAHLTNVMAEFLRKVEGLRLEINNLKKEQETWTNDK